MKCSTAVAALVLCLAAGVRAEERPRASLQYERGAGAERCPDEAAIRAQVARRLGYDPFQAEAEPVVVAVIVGAGRGLLARIALVRDGVRTGERRLPSARRDCVELAGALALAISIAVDPLSLGRAPAETTPVSPAPVTDEPEPPPVTGGPPAGADGQEGHEGAGEKEAAPTATTPPARAPPPPRATQPPSPAPPPRRVTPPPSPAPPPVPTQLPITLGFHAAVESAPSAAFGARLGIGVRRPRWSLHVEVRGDLPSSQPVQGGRVSTWLVAGAVVSCIHAWYFAGCAVAAAGVQGGAGSGYERSRSSLTPLAFAGGRAAIEFPVAGRLLVQLHADVLAAITRTTLTVGVRNNSTGVVDDVTVYRTSPVSAALGVALVVLLGGAPPAPLGLGPR